MGKEFIIKAIFQVDKKNRKKKLIEINFPDKTIAKLTDIDFIKSAKKP